MNSKNQKNLPIGIFDSGMGGLTVLKSLKDLLPQESFIYLGDTARLPYGTKSKDTIIKYATQMTHLLLEQNIKLLVIACNTATMAALEHLQNTIPNVPILGVIQPGALALVKYNHGHHVGVIATEATINSNIYPESIKKLNAELKVTSLACGLFVALAEEGCVNDELANAAIKKYLQPFSDGTYPINSLLLGCTHFPIFKPAIQHYLGPDIKIIDSASTIAEAVADALNNLNLNSDSSENFSRFFITDSPERFCRVGKLFYGSTIPETHVCLVDAIKA